MAGGWLKLSRNINAWRWRKDPATFSVWVWLLTHADESGRARLQESRIILDCGVSRQNARTAIKRLAAAPAEIIIGKDGNGAKSATIIGWEKYQAPPKGGQPKSNQKVTKDQPKSNQELTKKALTEYLLAKRIARENGEGLTKN